MLIANGPFLTDEGQNAPSKDSDETARMQKLIWIFTSAHVRLYVFLSCGLILD